MNRKLRMRTRVTHKQALSQPHMCHVLARAVLACQNAERGMSYALTYEWCTKHSGIVKLEHSQRPSLFFFSLAFVDLSITYLK